MPNLAGETPENYDGDSADTEEIDAGSVLADLCAVAREEPFNAKTLRKFLTEAGLEEIWEIARRKQPMKNEEVELDAEDILTALCVEAQQNPEFNGESVRAALEQADMLGLWEKAKLIGENEEEDEEDEDDEEEGEDEEEEEV